MEKEFLEDYEAKEKEDVEKFIKKLHKGEFRPDDGYPPKNRLKLIEPHTNSIVGKKIWYQIPFYGTTVIRILPKSEKESFEKTHGFEIGNIDRLIDFSKETGKIQFVLSAPPTSFQKINFLDPILNMRPPEVWTIDPIVTGYEKSKEWRYEFEFLSNITGFCNSIKPIAEKIYGVASTENWIGRHSVNYAALRMLGDQIDQRYHKIADEIAVQLSINHWRALELLIAVSNLITGPYTEPIRRSIYSFDRSTALDFEKRLGNFDYPPYRKIGFPCEVGKFLNDKLKLIIPENIEAAIELSDKYKLYDLRKVMNALNDAINKEKVDIVNEKSEEIATILDNVWNEVDELKRKIDIAKHGISLGIAVIGTLATMPVGGVGGLLAGLGFEVAEKIADIKAYEPVSEKIMRWTASSHLIHVYNFKKKYKLIGE